MKLPRLCLLLAAVTAQAQAPLCARLRALTIEPAVAAAHWGIAVETLDGTLLCGINQAQLFRPASNAKLFTAGAALALLGPKQTVVTSLSADHVQGNTLTGDLILRGAGDANLSMRPLPYVRSSNAAAARTHPLAELAAQVHALGIVHIAGKIIGDDSAWPNLPYAPGWPLDDIIFGYGAPVSALSVDDNKLELSVHPGAAPGVLASLAWKPSTDFYTVENDMLTGHPGSKTQIHIMRGVKPQTLRISGSIPLGAEVYTQDIAVDDPALYAATRLKAMLLAAGVQVDGEPAARHQAAGDADQAADHAMQVPLQLPANAGQSVQICLDDCSRNDMLPYASVPLAEDVTVILKVSQNLHAELLLRRLGEQFLMTGSEAAGARVIRQFWLNAGLPPNDFDLVDGSGLSPLDLVTPRALAQLLVFAARQPWSTVFRAALPIGGVDGSLAERFTGALDGRVFAKTGTLGESRALSGYVVAASGRTLVFSILVDNHLPNSTADRAPMDKMVELIATAN